MSILVQGLTKQFGPQFAIKDLSFEAQKGEILGFLGPNGAGKTTTMKILTGYQSPSAGRASVCGFDVVEDSMEVRKRIGYLPEHNPLYRDMYVREYLQFIAGLHGLKEAKQRVEAIIARTGLSKERHKIIGTLSKGYRQRVGLAQAMLHEPEVLILDEPMSGLDPNQMVEIRQLIRSLAENKTVIFSSHDMTEVEQLCDRVIIIKDGQLVANDKTATLRSQVAGSRLLTIRFERPIRLDLLQRLKGVQAVEVLEEGLAFSIKTALDRDLRAEIFHFAVRERYVLIELREEVFSIERVFQRLTNPT